MPLSELSAAISLALFVVGAMNLILVLLLAFLSLIVKHLPITPSIKDTIYYHIDEGGLILMRWEFAIVVVFIIAIFISGIIKWIGL